MDKFYQYATSGIDVMLFLELSGTTVNSNGQQESSLTEALIGPSTKFLHKLKISTLSQANIDRNIFKILPNLKMLDLEFQTSAGAMLSPSYFEGLTDLESLTLKLNGASSPLKRESFYNVSSLR